MKIVFATNNAHKLQEIREILGPSFEIVSLNDDALGGAPGVHSARYAEGTDHDSEANMKKLLTKLGDNPNRKARFRTVISLIQMEGGNPVCSREYRFEGVVEGHIAYEKHGTEGFGYDPVFIPDGYDKSFAELGEEVKNKISHRARAVKKLADWLNNEE